MPKNHKLQITLTEAQWERLKCLADNDKRSVTNYVTVHMDRTLNEVWDAAVKGPPVGIMKEL